MVSRPIHLELFCPDEADVVLIAEIDERNYEVIRAPRHRPQDDIDGQMLDFVEGRLNGDQLHWVIRDSLSQACLGSLQATLASGGVVSVGYRVISEHWGNGIATEALRLLLGQLASALPQRKIIANIASTNVASRRVLEKCGFTPVVALTGASSVDNMRGETFVWSSGTA
ncbi:GNAT family N-acetyltransferase [Duganella sp. Root1480D1]|uniref:GNAT family N-acetyltransferase n=1 Tax=Duganella sp. Root1480D1 TaxID=1736471 RepID=UPI0009E93AA2|nr:GNAT family N-acetyltransferase [Duganella sp. Root1480D1]